MPLQLILILDFIKCGAQFANGLAMLPIINDGASGGYNWESPN